VEDVVEAVALAETNAAQTRALAVSLAFPEGYSTENDNEDDVQLQTRKRSHIERNRERGNEEFPAITSSTLQRTRTITIKVDLEFQRLYFDSFAPQQQPQIHFSAPKMIRPDVLATVLSKR
jgi:hypothetical protein